MVNNNGPFPFQSNKEAWDYFTQASFEHFKRLLKIVEFNDPDIRQKASSLKYKAYCARLLYILNMFALQANENGEFDMAWAMLLAKPLSVRQAKEALSELIQIGLINEISDSSVYKNEDINGQTKFDFN